MLKCKELSRLPKVASGKYVNFRRQTPGSIADHVKPGNTPRPDCIDPSHPATSLNRFPSVRSDVLGVRAVPFATLSKPEQVWTTPSYTPFDTWTERIQRLLSTNADQENGEERLEIAPILLNNAKENAIPMSFINASSKKRTSNRKVIRGKISSRLKVAINLIVSRGADVTTVNGKPKLVMDEVEAEKMSDKWVSPGWTYIFFPTIEIYRMPYHEMIPLLRDLLRRIYELSQDLERKWASRATTQRKVFPPQSSYYARIPTQIGKLNLRKPLQNRGPIQTTCRTYSTRHRPATYSDSAKGSFDTKSPRKCDYIDLKTPKKFQSESSKRFSQSHRSNKSEKTLTRVPKLIKSIMAPHASRSDPPPEPGVKRTVRLGDVVFPIHNSSIPEDNCLKKIVPAVRKDDCSIAVLRRVRDDATLLLDRSREFHTSKLKRKSVRKHITLREAQRREPLGLQFIGFDSRPDPSYDPFTDVEPSPQPDAGPTPARKALLDLLNTSARMSPRDPGWIALPDTEGLGLLDPSEYSCVDSLAPADFAPLIHTEEKKHASAIFNKSVDKSPDRSSSPLEVDDFAPLDTTLTPFAPAPEPKADVTSPNIPSADTRSPEDLIQVFDPFHSEE